MIHVMLVGNPNCGKTTLFNALTGDNQRIGNWPGVTVEKKTGTFTIEHKNLNITDLPGIYSLTAYANSSSCDEQIAAIAIANEDADLIINVIDACNLERHLYLTSQLLELGKPIIVALSMVDIAKQRGISINLDKLSKKLNCPIVTIQAHQNIGLSDLKTAISSAKSIPAPLNLPLDKTIKDAISNIESHLRTVYSSSPESLRPATCSRDPEILINTQDYCTEIERNGSREQVAGRRELDGQPTLVLPNKKGLEPYIACRVLEGDTLLLTKDEINNCLHELNLANDLDIMLADARYITIHQIVAKVQQKKSDASDNLTAKIDRIVLHRFWSLPIFFAMIYLMFLFAINLGGAFQDFFDLTTDAIFVKGAASFLTFCHLPNWLVAIIANGVGKGINTTLTFVPVIAAMFFFLSLLESSGYMARAAFVIDRALRALGLPGKSFVPLIIGFGCNVPAIMAARTLDSEQDRFLTILMSPFMSCSARLTIYAVFVTAFFPNNGQNIVFSLYLIGILMAVITGFMLRKTILRGQSSPYIMELPSYHRPTFRRLYKETSMRVKFFILRAAKVIIPVSLILGSLNALTINGGISFNDASNESILSIIGQWITPIFVPMGLNADNWPATVGLISGMLAKEVVVGTLNTLYAQIGDVSQLSTSSFDLLASFKAAFWSIPQNIAGLGDAFINPIMASSSSVELVKPIYGAMYQHFDGKVGAYAYLLFILLYIPCVSTLAAIKQESCSKLMWFFLSWSFVVAYSLAVLFYQFATIMAHPQQTITWFFGLSFSITIFVFILRRLPHKSAGVSDALTTS